MFNDKFIGITLMILVALVQAIISVLSKVLHQSISIVFNTLFYYLIPCLFFIPTLIKNGIKQYKTKFIMTYIFRSIFSVAAVLLFFYASYILSLSQANLLFTTSPIFVAILAGIFLNEPTTKTGFVGIAISFAGVYCIVNPNTVSVEPIGLLLGLLSGIFMAFSQISLKYLVKSNEPSLKIVFYQYLYSTIIMLVIALYQVSNSSVIVNYHEYSLIVIVFLLCLTGVIGFLGQAVITKAFKYMPAPKLVPLLYIIIFYYIY